MNRGFITLLLCGFIQCGLVSAINITDDNYNQTVTDITDCLSLYSNGYLWEIVKLEDNYGITVLFDYNDVDDLNDISVLSAKYEDCTNMYENLRKSATGIGDVYNAYKRYGSKRNYRQGSGLTVDADEGNDISLQPSRGVLNDNSLGKANQHKEICVTLKQGSNRSGEIQPRTVNGADWATRCLENFFIGPFLSVLTASSQPDPSLSSLPSNQIPLQWCGVRVTHI